MTTTHQHNGHTFKVGDQVSVGPGRKPETIKRFKSGGSVVVTDPHGWTYRIGEIAPMDAPELEPEPEQAAKMPGWVSVQLPTQKNGHISWSGFDSANDAAQAAHDEWVEQLDSEDDARPGLW